MLKLETVEEIIEFAIAREQHAYELYKSIAEREVYSHVAELCEQLAKEELEHKQKLQQEFMKQGYSDLSIDVSDYIVHNNKKMIFMDSQEFLNFAIGKEEMAFKLYKKLAERTAKNQCKDVFVALAVEEEKHKEFLQKKLEDLLK